MSFWNTDYSEPSEQGDCHVESLTFPHTSTGKHDLNTWTSSNWVYSPHPSFKDKQSLDDFIDSELQWRNQYVAFDSSAPDFQDLRFSDLAPPSDSFALHKFQKQLNVLPMGKSSRGQASRAFGTINKDPPVPQSMPAVPDQASRIPSSSRRAKRSGKENPMRPTASTSKTRNLVDSAWQVIPQENNPFLHSTKCFSTSQGCDCNWRKLLDDIKFTSSKDVIDYLHDLKDVLVQGFSNLRWMKTIKRLTAEQGAILQDLLEKIIVEEHPSSVGSIQCKQWMRDVGFVTGALPRSLFLHGIKKDDPYPVVSGGFADIYKGTHKGRTVALKVLRSKPKEKEREKDICLEALYWHHLQHRHIIRLLGVCKDTFEPRLCLVSPWMEYGNIMQFCRKEREANRLQLMNQAAQGLLYLHNLDPPLIHGDMKGANLLINSRKEVCLTDFGLLTTSNPNSDSDSSGTVRWMAPELHTSDGQRSLQSDTYAFGLTLLEVFTGKLPFYYFPSEGQVLVEVVMREHTPRKPRANRYIGEQMWQLMTRCWTRNAEERPGMEEVERELHRLLLRVDVLRFESSLVNPLYMYGIR